MPAKNAYWIHDTVKDSNYLNGVKVLPRCKCSNCGYVSNYEKPVCPSCGAKIVGSKTAGETEDGE